MNWRIDERKMTGRKREPVASLEVSARELETLATALEGSESEDLDLLGVELAAARLALARENVGARGGSL